MNKIKLKKEGFRNYSFEFKDEQLRVEYVVYGYDVCTPKNCLQGWQVTDSDFMGINERLNRTRQGALDTFLFNNA
tara:strand:- start:25929 stop:26153 length:225 start_codon:yes stop_codon:yes gene_type:complete